MRSHAVLICMLTILAATAGTVRAQIINGHFDDRPVDPGELSGWVVEGPVVIQTLPSTATWPRNQLAVLREENAGRTRCQDAFPASGPSGALQPIILTPNSAPSASR